MTPPSDSSRTSTVRIEFWYLLSPETIRPVWPPEMPKTISIPASSRTRATSTFAGVSSVSIGSIVIAFLPWRLWRSQGRSLPFQGPQHNVQPPRSWCELEVRLSFGRARVEGEWCGYPSRLHSICRVLRGDADRRRRGCDVGGLRGRGARGPQWTLARPLAEDPRDRRCRIVWCARGIYCDCTLGLELDDGATRSRS